MGWPNISSRVRGKERDRNVSVQCLFACPKAELGLVGFLAVAGDVTELALGETMEMERVVSILTMLEI
jgi:hypothetical protein